MNAALYTVQDKKVTNITDIINMIYDKYPEPPVSTVLIVFARATLDTEVNSPHRNYANIHNLTVHKLNAIDEILECGMWNGKVKVVEAGSRMVEEAGDPFYKYYSNIAGGIVNFFLAKQADVLIGTEVSTFSVLAMNSRLYMENRENYFYRPQGLHWLTPPNVTKPHWFVC